MSGGAAPYKRGAAHEREVASFLRERGALVVRSPQSGQEMDLTALWPEVFIYEFPPAWLLQCKMGGYMRPAEREALIALAEKYGCRPILVGRKPFVFTDLATGGQIALPLRTSSTGSPDHPLRDGVPARKGE